MKVVIEGRDVRLDTKAVLGVGGQATVYRHGDSAVKIYHPVDPKAPARDRARDGHVRDELLAKMERFPANLPSCVVTPSSIVYDRRKRGIGYVMPLVQGGVEIALLSKRRHRANVVSNASVMRIFERLAAALGALHAEGVVVGDLNDGNVLVVGEDIRIIDVDTMQFGPFGCPVAHERFLDPRLYGVDLTTQPQFTPENDWFSFAVMLFSALLYVHPFGGVHPKIATFLRRAEAGISLLSRIVKRPKAAEDPMTLPEELLEVFLGFFERSERRPFDPALLSVSWTRCECGIEHARAICPACRSRGVVRPRPAVRHNGACRVTPIFETVGRLLAVTTAGRGARPVEWVSEENGMLLRDDNSVLDEAPLAALDTSYTLVGDTLWIGRGNRVVRLNEGVDVVATSTFEGRPAFAPWPSGAVVVDNDWLIEYRTGMRIGPVLSGSTWVATGPDLGFGFYRARNVTKYFLFTPGRAGLRFVELPSIRGRIRSVHAAFDARTVVFSIVTDENGVDVSRLYVVDATSKVRGVMEGAMASHRVLAAPQGRCVHAGQVVTATEDGLALLTVAQGVIAEATLFADTEPFVSAQTEILNAPGGGVYAVTPQTITQLTLS